MALFSDLTPELWNAATNMLATPQAAAALQPAALTQLYQVKRGDGFGEGLAMRRILVGLGCIRSVGGLLWSHAATCVLTHRRMVAMLLQHFWARYNIQHNAVRPLLLPGCHVCLPYYYVGCVCLSYLVFTQPADGGGRYDTPPSLMLAAWPAHKAIGSA